jgi:16S rRNA G966 N2-methylase RsmD
VFVDSSSDAIRAIRDNLSRAGLADGARVERDEVARFVRRDPGEVDLAFLDPPYTFPEPDLRDILDHLTPHLVTGATVVLTRPRRAATDVIPVNLQVGKHLDYGDARILVLEVP